MGIFNFYNMRKPRRYDHKPIYFDPRKEALEKRIHKVKMELGVEETDYEQYKEAIKGSFVEGTTHLKKSKDKGDDIRNRVYKNMRLILILAILGVVLWYFYFK
ncbi:MAG: hypothetical protein LBH77_00565 [Tannerella sp.]|jgi:hypothetical protein|nr:hypothetical protein [Tannerella sp.]